MQLLGLNTLDLLLIFILFIGALVGFMRGLGPQLMSAASIWLALLASLWTYRLLSVNIFIESGWFGKTSSDAMAFLVMFLVFFNVLRLVIKFLTKPPEEKKKKPRRKGQVGPTEVPPPSATKKYLVGPIGALSSIMLGLILTTLWTAILLGVAQFFFQVNVSEVGGVAVPGFGFVRQMQASVLMPYFNRVLQILVTSLDLFVLDDSADILKQVVCAVFPGSC